MRNCVFSLLLPLLGVHFAACAAPKEPTRAPEEATVQPLVVGHSPEIAIAASPEESPRSDDPAAPAPTTLAVRARDPRLAKATRRDRGLVITELQQLELLFGSTAATSPDRPPLARRLAEDYAELARVTEGPTAVASHKHALKYYELLTTDHPQYPQLDEAYYYAALEHELAGNLTGARRAYFELIKRSPNSKFIALAYFAFGEMFFEEAAKDPSKNDLAEQAFKEVLKFPAPGNTVYADAKHRIEEIKLRRP